MIEPVFIDNCRITVGQYMHYTLSLYLNSYWWVYALPLAVCLALSSVNINFLFVAIVLLFLVFTIVLFVAIIYYALVPEIRFSIMSKEVIVSEVGIDVILKKNTDTKTDDKPKFDSDSVLEKVFLHRKNIKGFEIKDDCLLVLFKEPKFSFIVLPYTSFRRKSDIERTMNFIKGY